MNAPCKVTVTRNGDYHTCNEEWDNFEDAEGYCDSLVKRGLCTYYKIESADQTLTYHEEDY